MKRIAPITAIVWLFCAAAASADCVAEYKAKKENPTDYRHTTHPVPASECTPDKAAAYVQDQIKAEGWKVLEIVRISG